MNTLKFLDAIRNQDTSVLSTPDKELADGLLAALEQTSREFHEDALRILENVTMGNDMEEMIRIINALPPRERTQLLAFVTTGDATQSFGENLNTNPQLQRAVDIAFAAHIAQLPDLEQAIENAKVHLKEGGNGDGD